MSIELSDLTVTPPRGSRVLCAVSGGADSMCLLHLLWANRERLGIEVLAAHYEHGLRGEESLRDAAFVENWCREREIPCAVEHGDVPAWARAHGQGEEEAARELRYAFLERAAEALDCGWIATAHHAGDNAETMLFHLARGGGAAGLRGIPPRRGKILRPLLRCTGEQIRSYLREQNIPHVEDASNDSDGYSRNLIRHRVVPVLRQINPRFEEAASRTAWLLRQDEDCLRGQAEDFLRRYYDGESLPAAQLGQLHWSVASRVLRLLRPEGLSLGHVRALLALTEGTELAFADVPGGRVRRERGRLYFREAPCRPPLPDRTFGPEGTLDLPERGLRLVTEPVTADKEIYGLFKTSCFKYEKICGNISCGGPRPGDRLRPFGRGCTKSLKSLFAEAGWTERQRREALVFRDGAGILAVYGLVLSERAAPSLGDRAVRIKLERTEGE